MYFLFLLYLFNIFSSSVLIPLSNINTCFLFWYLLRVSFFALSFFPALCPSLIWKTLHQDISALSPKTNIHVSISIINIAKLSLQLPLAELLYLHCLFVCLLLSRIGNTSSHLHYMMFQTIQTIYFL